MRGQGGRLLFAPGGVSTLPPGGTLCFLAGEGREMGRSGGEQGGGKLREESFLQQGQKCIDTK